MSKKAYTREEAAAECSVSVDTIKRAINKGALKGKRSGPKDEQGNPTGKYLILEKDLDAWLEGLEAA